MVDKKLIIDTINELLDANVDKETVISTLKDIGVDSGDIDSNYNEVISNRDKEEVKEEPKETPKKEDKIPYIDIHSVDTHKPKEEPKTENVDSLENEPEDKHETELKKTTSEVHEINEAHEEPVPLDLSSDTSSSTTDSKQLSEIQAQITELKAQMSGLTKIMKDILEENRNILNKL